MDISSCQSHNNISGEDRSWIKISISLQYGRQVCNDSLISLEDRLHEGKTEAAWKSVKEMQKHFIN